MNAPLRNGGGPKWQAAVCPDAHTGRPSQVPAVIEMPRSIQEILDHADELARRFEEYEPTEGGERPVEDARDGACALSHLVTQLDEFSVVSQ